MAVSKTKAKLVDVARQLFAKMGVENTTMNDIALASKKGRRTLYTYFKSKEDNLYGCCRIGTGYAFGHDEACGGEEYIAGREDD